MGPGASVSTGPLALSRAIELRRLRADTNEPAARNVLPSEALELLAVHLENVIRQAIGTDGARRFLPEMHDLQDAIRSELSRRGERS